MLQNDHDRTCPRCGTHLPPLVAVKTQQFQLNAAKMIARHLSFSLQIRPGNDLVLLLGTGSETNNLEAITSWVRIRVEGFSKWPIPGCEAMLFIDQLERELANILQDMMIGEYNDR